MPSCTSNSSCKPCKPATKSATKKKSTAKRSAKKPSSRTSFYTKSKTCSGRCGACCSKKNHSKIKKAPVQRRKTECFDGKCTYSSDSDSDSSHSSDCSCSECYSTSYLESSSDSDGGCYQGRNKGGGCKK